MAKTAMEKALEKQQKEQRKIAREAQIRDRATAIVSDAKHIGEFRIMDKESEMLLEEILKQYDGNDNNYVNFNEALLPRALQESISLQFEKLQMYGVLASANIYVTGAMVTLSESGKSYFEDKRSAENQAANDMKKETSIMRKQYDVFISHANKDKDTYVDSLNAAVRRLGVNIFYDTDVLSWGDNWKQTILDGTKAQNLPLL